LDLRTSHEQIIYLLSSEEKNNLKIEQKLDMFKKIDLSICNEYNEQFWDVSAYIWIYDLYFLVRLHIISIINSIT